MKCPLTFLGLLVLFSFGYYLIVFKSGEKTRIDIENNTNKLELEIMETIETINLIRKEASSDSIDEQLNDVNVEFTQWASNFLSNRVARKLEYKQDQLSSNKRDYLIFGLYRPFFSLIISSIRDLVNAYNLKAGTSFSVELPTIPEYLYNDYKGRIVFRADAAWYIRIGKLGGLPPILFIYFVNNQKEIISENSISFIKLREEISISIDGNMIPESVELQSITDVDYQNKLIKAIEYLFEVQLHNLDTN